MRIILPLACPENSIAFLQIGFRAMLELLRHPVTLEVVKNWASFFYLSSCHAGLWDPSVNSNVMTTLAAT